MNSRQRRRTCAAVLVLGCTVLMASTLPTAADPDEDVLVTVNGDPITTAEIDRLLMETHREAGAGHLKSMDLTSLLTKAVNDRLILQEARAMGLDEEEQVRRPVDENRATNAARVFAEARFEPPESVPEAAVRDYFEKYYWKIGLRQVSVRTQQEAQAVLDAITTGASMDSLARAVSLDTHRYEGGLHNFKYWADVENVLRDQLRDASVGDVRGPFPFREAYAVVRVERIGPVEWDVLPTYETSIQAFLVSERRKQAWREFLDGLRHDTPVTLDPAALARIDEDAASVFTGEFLTDSSAPVLRIDEDWLVTESVLRKEISRAAMRDGKAPFETVRDRGIEKATDDLVLRRAAHGAGFFDDPEVVREYERDLEQTMLEVYLEEVIVPRISVSRAEFEEFYEQNRDRFRGPDQVRLSMLILEDEATAREVAGRLASGADFGFLEQQYGDLGTAGSKGDWIDVSLLSEAIQEQLDHLEVGQSGEVLEIPSGWLVFKLDAKRPGPVEPLEEVETKLRQVMFQKKFNEEMDRHLGLLKERSDIVYHQARIDAYFELGS